MVLGHFDRYHWVYWAGPLLGALVAVIFYRIIKVLEYESANPGQDFNEKEVSRCLSSSSSLICVAEAVLTTPSSQAQRQQQTLDGATDPLSPVSSRPSDANPMLCKTC